MNPILAALFVTALLALAVKQLAMALMHGSVFDGLRRAVHKRMEQRVPGFLALNQLMTCKLCLSMNVSLWVVVLPAAAIGITTNVGALIGLTSSSAFTAFSIILASFLYGMAVSGLAKAFWNFLEFPESRYQKCASDLTDANDAAEDLREEIGTLQVQLEEAQTTASV